MMLSLNLIACSGHVLSGPAIRSVLNNLAVCLPNVYHENTQQSVRHISSKCDRNRKRNKSLTMENVNPNIVALKYAVRGPVYNRALELDEELKKGVKKPFNKIIKANIGDSHAMGQKPITFIRQILACVTWPSLIETSDFPCDVKERAREVLTFCAAKSVGSYTISTGIEPIRKNVAAYIEKRDGHPSDYNKIALTTGATTAIKHVMQLFSIDIGGKKSSIMVPAPQYPLYSAARVEYGLGQTIYYLDEEHNWSISVDELERSYCEGSKKYNVRGIVVINPGNPTGQALTRENIEAVIKFAHDKKLFMFADEVYQHNVYAEGSKFHSFKKVMTGMSKPYCNMELASFMSISKGYMGECGLRGGWMELCNFDPGVLANLYKAMSAVLCPNSLGQIVIDCVARPPKEGDPSYELFMKETTNILSSLAERAKMAAETFNKMDGFTCNIVQGAMYAFPRITLPPKAIEAAKAAGKNPDEFYALKLVEETGICIIPGSGFGQKPGTWHFRTTILPQTPLLKEMLEIFQKFHAKFTKEYS